MVFNLTTHASFPYKGPSKCPWLVKGGPFFGDHELSAYEEPFNKENTCKSYTNEKAFRIPMSKEGINRLTNQKNNDEFSGKKCNFTISELEVWGVSFNE